MYSTTEIARLTGADVLQQPNNLIIEHLLLDSRKLLFPETSLFFALGGPRRSGIAFIDELYQKGVRSFVVDDAVEASHLKKYPEAVFLQVKNVLHALQLLVTSHRKKFQLPVVGITGSNGKTIVKEWLYQLLQKDFNIVRSPKSYNSQIGVPLSVWQMNSQHTLGIFEAGISQPGEMQQLEKMIAPSIGVFTNIGEAHGEGFLNIRQKINEKLCLFTKSDWLIYNADNPDINEAVNAFVNNVRPDGGLKLFTWGKKESATLQIVSIEKNAGNTIITAIDQRAVTSGQQHTISIPFTDDASIENAITCCCVLLQLDIPAGQMTESMRQLRTVEMRLELKQGINNCSIINDSYSADINSLTIALDFLSQQQQHINHTLVLSDILQTGKSSQALYADIAAILQQKKINRLIGIGPEIFKQQAAFSNIAQTNFFSSVADFKQHFHALHFFNETILLKGARVFEFEQISHLLEEKVHQTVLEINLSAITHNLRQYQQLVSPGVKLMAMVKAFSYGSGSFEIANLLQFHKVDYLAVAFADEGVELRKSGISLPVMVMTPEENTFDVMVQYDLEPELYSFNILQSFSNYLALQGIENYPVHIKFDTGMHRLGFEEQDIEPLKALLQQSSRLKIQSVFSHLVASDDEQQDHFTKQQAATFTRLCNQLKEVVNYSFLRHIANTSAIMRHRELQFDMVRLGIGLYGVDSYAPMQQQLQNVTTLKTTIAQIRKVKAGDSVGYNRAAIMKEDALIATVRIGYADGYPRILGNGNGKMLVNGKLATVTGNVCMDMTMLNITGIEAREGDTVIVFGAALPVTNVGKWAHTIAYEILAGISQRVKRVYYEE